MAMLTTQQIHERKEQAKEIFKSEFMERYDEWFMDRVELNDHDYGWKYGWQKSEKLLNLKDNLTAVAMFQKYIYPSRRDEKIEEQLGIEKQVVWALSSEGWLSSIQRNWKNLYFVNQQRAKEIWKEARGK